MKFSSSLSRRFLIDTNWKYLDANFENLFLNIPIEINLPIKGIVITRY
jgi:hypothetical protein